MALGEVSSGSKASRSSWSSISSSRTQTNTGRESKDLLRCRLIIGSQRYPCLSAEFDYRIPRYPRAKRELKLETRVRRCSSMSAFPLNLKQ